MALRRESSMRQESLPCKTDVTTCEMPSTSKTPTAMMRHVVSGIVHAFVAMSRNIFIKTDTAMTETPSSTEKITSKINCGTF